MIIHGEFHLTIKKPVYSTPEHQLFASARYRLGKTLFVLGLQQIVNLDTDFSLTVAMSNYTLVNSKISHNICRFAEIFDSAENLLNQKYEQIRYYPMPGTTLFVGVNLKF